MVLEVTSYATREQCSQWDNLQMQMSWKEYLFLLGALLTVLHFLLLNRGKIITESLLSFKKKILTLCNIYLPSCSRSLRAVTFGVHPGLTARCSLGWVVGEYTQLSPSRAQPSSPFSFCSG